MSFIFNYIKSLIVGDDDETISDDEELKKIIKEKVYKEVEKDVKNNNSVFDEDNHVQMDDEIDDVKETYSDVQEGIITSVKKDGGVINKLYLCKSEDVMPHIIQVGDTVKYQIKINDTEERSSLFVKVVEFIPQESKTSLDLIKPNDLVGKEFKLNKKIRGKITHKDNMYMKVDDKYTLDLNVVQCTCVFEVGDIVNIHCSFNLNTGDITEYSKVVPAEKKFIENCVITNYSEDMKVGIIKLISSHYMKTNLDIAFSKCVCKSGYLPKVNDQVSAHIIESNQEYFQWRALSVELKKHMKSNKIGDTNDSNSIDAPMTCNGVIARTISINQFNVSEHLNDKLLIKIELRNTSNISKTITRVVFDSETTQSGHSFSQLRTLHKNDKRYIQFPCTIAPMKYVEYTIGVIPRFFGKSVEKVSFLLRESGELKVSVPFEIIYPGMKLDKRPSHHRKKQFYNSDQILSLQQSLHNVVRGVKPMMAMKFQYVQIPEYKVPDQLLVAYLGTSENPIKRRENSTKRLLEVCPLLLDQLTENNYLTKFHACLYLEEIHLIASMRTLDIEKGTLKHNGEFLALYMLGLGEARPSLIVGDKVIAFIPDNINIKDKSNFEGFIHDIRHDEVLIKFATTFHQSYQGETYSFRFIHSRTVFRRCHYIVDSIVSNLGIDWFFPSTIEEKAPIISILGEDQEIIKPEYLKKKPEVLNEKIKRFFENFEEKSSVNVKMEEKSSVDVKLEEKSSIDVKVDETSSVQINGNHGQIVTSNTNNMPISNHDHPSLNISSESKANGNLSERENIDCEKQVTIEKDFKYNNEKMSTKIEENVIKDKNDFEKNLNVKNIVNDDGPIFEKLSNCTRKKPTVISPPRPLMINKPNTETNLKNKTNNDENSDDINVHLSKDIKNCCLNIKTDFKEIIQNKNIENIIKPNGVASDEIIEDSKEKTDYDVKSDNINENLSEHIKNRRQSMKNYFTEIIQNKNIENIIKPNGADSDEIIEDSNDDLKEKNDNDQNSDDINENLSKHIKNEIKNSCLNIKTDFKEIIQNKNIIKLNDVASDMVIEKTDNDKIKEINWGRIKKSNVNWVVNHPGMGLRNNNQNKINIIPNRELDIKWFDRTLNWHQKAAVRNILKFQARPLPYIIFGPPGTGKTVTVTETVLQIYNLVSESRLIIATPSNSSADMLTERLLESGNFDVGDLVRLVSLTHIRGNKISPSIAPYCCQVDTKHLNDYEKVIENSGGVTIQSRESLLQHRIIISTCSSFGQLIPMGTPIGYFTHCIIDEAGQANEPECLLPISFLHKDNGHVVLAGDPLQLGPVIMSKVASDSGLGTSLLERLIKRHIYSRDNVRFYETDGYDPRLVTRLVDNYRTLDEILKISSDLFYDSSLIPHVTIDDYEGLVLKKMKDCLPSKSIEKKCPAGIIFHGVSSDNIQDKDSPSWYNIVEAMIVIGYLKKLYECGLSADQVGIITPYRKQVVKIRDLINGSDITLPKVASIEEFQGQERLVIIISTVRSMKSFNYVSKDLEQCIGFIGASTRLNVAITRARALLIIVGDPNLLAEDPQWKKVIEYIYSIGGYTGCTPGTKELDFFHK